MWQRKRLGGVTVSTHVSVTKIACVLVVFDRHVVCWLCFSSSWRDHQAKWSQDSLGCMYIYTRYAIQLPGSYSFSMCTPLLGQATCGSYHTAAVTDKGELYTWGGGMYGKVR